MPDYVSIPHGIAKPRQRATMSAPLQGVLVEVLVSGGDQVKTGQLLATMDSRIALAAVNAARATADRTSAIEQAKHALELARSLLARHSALEDSQAGSAFELEQARSQYNQAQATLTSALESQLQAKRNLELEETRLEAHRIRAPFDGKILRIESTVGTTLSPAEKLLTIACLDSLEAELHMPLDLYGELQVGETYQLWGFAPVNRQVQAKLVFASPSVNSASKTFACVFVIDNHDHQLPAGFGLRFDSSQTESLREDVP